MFIFFNAAETEESIIPAKRGARVFDESRDTRGAHEYQRGINAEAMDREKDDA